MSGGKDESVGEVFSVFDEASSRKAANHRAVCGGKLGFLKVSDRGARLIPRVDAKNGGLDLAQEGFIDGHIAGGGGGGVKEQAKGHEGTMGTRRGAGKSCQRLEVC